MEIDYRNADKCEIKVLYFQYTQILQLRNYTLSWTRQVFVIFFNLPSLAPVNEFKEFITYYLFYSTFSTLISY